MGRNVDIFDILHYYYIRKIGHKETEDEKTLAGSIRYF